MRFRVQRRDPIECEYECQSSGVADGLRRRLADVSQRDWIDHATGVEMCQRFGQAPTADGRWWGESAVAAHLRVREVRLRRGP